MGFIDKALELARKQQEGTLGGESRREIKNLDIMPVTEQGEELPPLDRIDYSVTKTLPIDLQLLSANRLIVGGIYPLINESYKILRTQIIQKTWSDRRNTLMITSPLPSEGKTLTSINLAIALSQEVAHTVLLVDTDLRAPSVTSYLGIPQEPGLLDYLEGRKSIPEVLIHPQGLEKLVILPAGGSSEWAAELIRSPQMKELVQELKNFYPNRYIIFDLPPLLSYADAMAFAPLVDGILVVVEARRTLKTDLQKCKDMLRNFPVLGYVFNKADEVNHSRYYRHNGYKRYLKEEKEDKSSWLSRWKKK